MEPVEQETYYLVSAASLDYEWKLNEFRSKTNELTQGAQATL